MSDLALSMRVLPDLGHLNVRGKAKDSALIKAIEAALGQSLPVAANTMSNGDHLVYWLGPDEWLVSTGASGVRQLQGRLAKQLDRQHVAINDISGGNVVVELKGERVRDVFAKGCTLDFHPDVFTVDTCAQSGLGKATALFARVDDAPTYTVIVRRSFSDYLLKWLGHAGAEFGIEFE